MLIQTATGILQFASEHFLVCPLVLHWYPPGMAQWEDFRCSHFQITSAAPVIIVPSSPEDRMLRIADNSPGIEQAL